MSRLLATTRVPRGVHTQALLVLVGAQAAESHAGEHTFD